MRFLAIIMLSVGASPCLAQDSGREATRGALFIEFAGNTFLGGTLNAEVFLNQTVALRAGAGRDGFTQTKVFPLHVVLLAGAGSSKLELAAGVTVAQEGNANWNNWDGTKAFPGGFLGYRYQRPRGFLFRIGVVPHLWSNNQFPWFALGIGTAF